MPLLLNSAFKIPDLSNIMFVNDYHLFSLPECQMLNILEVLFAMLLIAPVVREVS